MVGQNISHYKILQKTTRAPDGASGRIRSDEDRYNRIALETIEKHGIAADDLNAFIREKGIPHVRPDDVHFSKGASAQLGQRAAETIRARL